MSDLPAATRIAPTPSGYLHRGNAVNFLLVRWLADAIDATVRLRIDDMDVDRYRQEYVQDVFEVLHWLGIDWQGGPVDVNDFQESHSLGARTHLYRDEAARLQAAGFAYACTCSRRHGGGQCVQDCRSRQPPLTPGQSALRLAIAPGTTIEVDGTAIDLVRELGDPVLWRRDDRVSYHLASVIEDRDQGITHVIRGEDLRVCSALHLHLAELLGSTTEITYRHHPLLVDERGVKLSKSQMQRGPLPRTDAVREDIYLRAEVLAQALLRRETGPDQSHPSH